MRQIIHIVGIALFCAIAISNAGTASETGGGHYLADVKSGKLILERGRSSPSGETAYRPESWSVVAEQVVKPAEENTTKIELVQDEDTPEKKNDLSNFLQQHYNMNATGQCGGTGQIAACSVSCAAACIFKCAPPAHTPWDSECKSCSNACMDQCTGCGGTIQ